MHNDILQINLILNLIVYLHIDDLNNKFKNTFDIFE